MKCKDCERFNAKYAICSILFESKWYDYIEDHKGIAKKYENIYFKDIEKEWKKVVPFLQRSSTDFKNSIHYDCILNLKESCKFFIPIE